MKFIAGGNARVPNEFYDKTKQKVAPYIKKLNEVASDTSYAYPESALNLVCDEAMYSRVEEHAHTKHTRALKYIFVCGIGGSSLGAKALYESWFMYTDCYFKHKPHIIFVDTVNSNLTNHILSIITELRRPNDFLLIGITKSGTTTETAANLEIITEQLSQKFNKRDVYKRTVFITDESSKLWEEGRNKKISFLQIPEKVGGRFSVFSPVGLFPLAFTGISLRDLRKSAQNVRNWCLHTDLNDNPAFASAAILYYHLQNGKSISNTFFFNSEFEALGKWYRQLLGESLGKEANQKDIPNSITPLVSIGSTDLHSVAQLFLGGQQDKTTTFVRMKYKDSVRVPDPQTFSLVPHISGKSQEKIMDAIYEGTKKAYEKANLPFIEIILEDYYDVAAFMQFKMTEVMILAHLLGEDAFTQPHIETYKSETRRILEGGKGGEV